MNKYLIVVVVVIVIVFLALKNKKQQEENTKPSTKKPDTVTNLTNQVPQYFPVPVPPQVGPVVVVASPATTGYVMNTNVYNQKSPVTIGG